MVLAGQEITAGGLSCMWSYCMMCMLAASISWLIPCGWSGLMKKSSDDPTARLDVLKTLFIRGLAHIVVTTTR